MHMGSDAFIYTVWSLIVLWLLSLCAASYLAIGRRSWRWTAVALAEFVMGVFVYSIVVRVLE
jgi:hypothetical protein